MVASSARLPAAAVPSVMCLWRKGSRDAETVRAGAGVSDGRARSALAAARRRPRISLSQFDPRCGTSGLIRGRYAEPDSAGPQVAKGLRLDAERRTKQVAARCMVGPSLSPMALRCRVAASRSGA